MALTQQLEATTSTPVLCQDLIDYRCFKEIVKQWDEPGPKMSQRGVILQVQSQRMILVHCWLDL